MDLYQAFVITYQIFQGIDIHIDSLTNLSNSITLRFPIPGVAAVANDVYLSPYRVTLPRNSGNDLLGSAIMLTLVAVSAKTAPSGSDYIVDILQSQDKEVTFNTILGPDNPGKLILPKSAVFSKYSNKFSHNTLEDGDYLRFDNIQADGIVADIEIILQGVLLA